MRNERDYGLLSHAVISQTLGRLDASMEELDGD
jgi:hypothetical protein